METAESRVRWRSAAAPVCLRVGRMLRFAGGEVLCRQGRLWLTAEGDGRDYLLRAGECYRGARRILIEALEDSELQMTPSPQKSSRKRLVSLSLGIAFAIVYLVWGSTYLAIRFAIESLPPFGMAGARFLAAGLILALGLTLRGAAWPTCRQILGAFLIGVLLLAIGNGGIVWAESVGLPSGIAAMIVATTPLWMMILDRLLDQRHRLQPTKLLAGVAGLSGVAFLVYPSRSELLPAVPLLPALMAVLSSFSWSLGSILSRLIPLPKSPWWSTSLGMIGGGFVLFCVSLLRGEMVDFQLARVTAVSWLSWLYLVIFGSIVGFSAYLYLLKHSSPARVSTYALVNPVVALLLGWLWGGEGFSARIGLAALIIFPSVFILIGKKEKQDAASVASPGPGRGLDSSLELT